MIDIVKKHKYTLVIAALVIVIQCTYLVVIHPPLGWFDSAIYETTAWNFSQGAGFNYTPGISDAYREPGYSFFFISPMYFIVGRSILAIQIAQALLSALTAVLIIKLGSRYLTPSVGYIAASMYAIYPAIIVNNGEVMTEGFFMFLMTAFIFSALRAMDKRSYTWISIAAILLGMAALTRIVVIPLILGFVIILAIQVHNWRFTWRAGLLFISIAMAIYSPWVVRNYNAFDRFVLGRTGGGEIIWTGSYIPWDGDWQGYIWPLTEYQGGNYFDHDAFMVNLAKKNIQADPAGVLWLWLKKPLKIFVQPEGFGYSLNHGAFKGNMSYTILVVTLSIVHLTILFFVVVGIWHVRKYRIFALVTLAYLGYFLIVYMPLNGIPRYAVPLYPIILLYAALGFVSLIQRRSTLATTQSHVCFVALNAYGLFDASAGIYYGGAEVQLYNLASSLTQDHKAEVSFVTKALPRRSITNYHGIRLYRTISSKRHLPLVSNFLFVAQLFYFVWRINADVYVQRAVGPETGLISLYCRILGKRFVYMIAHEWDVSGEYLKRNGVLGRLSFSGIRNANTIIAQNTEQQKMLLGNFNLSSTVLSSLYEIPETLPNVSDRKYILWVGRAETWKQPHLFLELAQKMPTEKFVMIMPQGNYPEYYQELIQKLSAIDNINFISEVPLHEMDTYFSSAKLFVNTSTTEGFPNTFIQAAKNATPVVSLAVNPDNLLENFGFGSTAHNSPSILCTIVEELIRDDEKRTIMAKQGYIYAQQHHDIKVIGQKFYQIVIQDRKPLVEHSSQ